MFKKFFAGILLAFTIMFISNNSVEAQEVYVGNYSDGTAVYVLTETMGIKKVGGGVFYCTVRAGKDYLKYDFWSEDEGWKYKNSEGYHGYVYDGSSPVAAAIFNYIKPRISR